MSHTLYRNCMTLPCDLHTDYGRHSGVHAVVVPVSELPKHKSSQVFDELVMAGSSAGEAATVVVPR
jgi:hypothetical protein